MARSSRAGGVDGPAAKGRGKPVAVKVKLSLDRETVRLLKLEAFGRDVSLGLVVDELVRSAPRRFVLMDRARGSQGAEGAEDHRREGAQRPPGGQQALGVVSEAG